MSGPAPVVRPFSDAELTDTMIAHIRAEASAQYRSDVPDIGRYQRLMPVLWRALDTIVALRRTIRSLTPKDNTAMPKGFAALTSERRKEIASKGGRAAQAKGGAHRFTTENASDAGRKGGLAVSTNLEHMAAIGKKGGKAKRTSRRRT